MYGKIEETSNEETPTGELGVNEGDLSESDDGGSPGPSARGEDSEPEADAAAEPEPLTALRFVGPATARVLTEADVAPADLRERRVSYRELVDAGVNAGVAARIRREHSLSWTFSSTDGDLGRRSAQVRGLDDAERAWIAASSGDWENAPRADDGNSAADSAGGDWAPSADGARRSAGPSSEGDWEPAGGAPTEADGSGDPRAAESAWRERSAPEPLVDLGPIDEEIAAELAEAGVTSIRRLSTIDPEHVADALQIDPERVRAWHEAARAHRA